MTTFDYFAYGSNLSTARMRARCSSATVQAIGFIRQRELRFHKIGVDGTGKADAFYTGNHTDVLWGVIYRCRLTEKPTLDRCESLGIGYELASVAVHVGRQTRSALLYQAIANCVDHMIRPSDWYYDHVVHGAREHGFPVAYQRKITQYEPFVCRQSRE